MKEMFERIRNVKNKLEFGEQEKFLNSLLIKKFYW